VEDKECSGRPKAYRHGIEIIVEKRFVPNARRTCIYIRNDSISNFTLFECEFFYNKL